MLRFKRQILDDDRRIYHSRNVLTEKRIEGAAKGKPPLDGEDMMGIGISMGAASTIIDPAAPVENPILELVLEMPGVEMAACTPYALLVVKAKNFEWSEVDRNVLKILTSLHLPIENSRVKETA